MKRAAILVCVFALVSVAAGKNSKNNPYGVEGTVTSLNGNYFKMEANIPMMVFVDANTVVKIEETKVSAAYIVKGAKVSVAGGSNIRGRMNAQLVEIIPTGKPVTGTVKRVSSSSFILECSETSVFKVTGGAFTKFDSDEAKKPKVGMKLTVTPVTDNTDTIDAYRIAVAP